MPISKVNKSNNSDIIVKHLRRRKISCRVPAVTTKESTLTSPSKADLISNNNISSNQCLKKRSVKATPQKHGQPKSNNTNVTPKTKRSYSESFSDDVQDTTPSPKLGKDMRKVSHRKKSSKQLQQSLSSEPEVNSNLDKSSVCLGSQNSFEKAEVNRAYREKNSKQAQPVLHLAQKKKPRSKSVSCHYEGDDEPKNKLQNSLVSEKICSPKQEKESKSTSMNGCLDDIICGSTIRSCRESPKPSAKRKKSVNVKADLLQSSPLKRSRTKSTRYQDYCCDSLSPSPERPRNRSHCRKNSSEDDEDFEPKNLPRPKSAYSLVEPLLEVQSRTTTPNRMKNRIYRRRGLYSAKSVKWEKVLNATFPILKDSAAISSEILVEVPQKKHYQRKDDSSTDISPKSKKLPTISVFNVEECNSPSATVVVEVAKKRAYRRKKRFNLTNMEAEGAPKETPPESVQGFTNFTSTNPVQLESETLNQSLSLPVTKNTQATTELEFAPSTCTDSESTLSQLTVSASDSDWPPKRGRGRPRKSQAPVLSLVPMMDDELTCTSCSTASTGSETPVKRCRRSRWEWEDEEEVLKEEEPMSEYELLRKRNIEENLKMLKQLFSEQGLQFEDKSSDDTPKIRKIYTKLPPPPPRPKSVRLETKYSASPLDFSKFSHRISLP